MKKFIKVYKNILNPRLVDKVEEILLNKKVPYNYLQNIADNNSNLYRPGFVHLFQSKSEYIETDYSSFLSQILYNFCQIKQINILSIINSRTFLHIPTTTSGPDNIHVDLEFPHWVCLYYVNDSDGDTILFDDNNKEIKRVTPEKGKIVFFDGSIYHSGTPSGTKSRAVVNFDFIPYL